MKTATFEKGIHPEDQKELSKDKPIAAASLPERAVIPLSQHIGAPTEPVVAIGDSVKRGQVISNPKGFVSTYIHASISGKVISSGTFPTPMGRMVQCIIIETDGKDEGIPFKEHSDYQSLDAAEIRKLIREAGIVGLGGATFPSDVKLSPPKEKTIDTVIINGAECEPYLTADDRLMVEKPDEVIAGLKIIMQLLGVRNGYIGIENNKPLAITSMEKAASQEPSIEVYSLNVRYPQGAEKVLIKAITGREVPSRGGLPMDIGVVVHNAGTAAAVYEAVRYGKPLYERVVTLTGRGIKEPHNFLARIGTPVSQLIEECGGLTGKATKIIMGGPMMGFAIGNMDFPVIKGTSGIVVMNDTEYVDTDKYYPCIRCGRCINVCPMGLIPSLLSVFSEKAHYEDAKEYNLFDCFECGCCAYVCPSKRPIVQLVRLAKSMTKPN